MEGYFNNRSVAGSPHNLRENGGVSKVTTLISYYDDIEKFIERTNGRTGKERGMVWAENSPGWKDNAVFIRMMEKYQEGIGEKDTLERVDNIDSPRDFLVTRFFNDSFNWVPPQEKEKKVSLTGFFKK